MHLCLNKFSTLARSGSGSLIAVALCSFYAFAQSPSDWGVPGDIRVQGSFVSGGYLDYAVWRPSNGTWYVFLSEFPSNNFADYYPITVQLGLAGDVPVPADYDDDFLTDFAVWRPSNGIWYIRSSKTGLVSEQQWGLPGDIPIPGTFAVTGEIDLAVWRPSNGNWYILPGDGSAPYTVQLGLPGDIPVRGDFDGDQIQYMAVWSPANALWYVRLSSHPNGPPMIMQWGLPGDIPVPGDYDEDGKTDFAVWRHRTKRSTFYPAAILKQRTRSS